MLEQASSDFNKAQELFEQKTILEQSLSSSIIKLALESIILARETRPFSPPLNEEIFL